MRLPIKHLQEELYRQQKQLGAWKEKDGQGKRAQLIDRVKCFKNAIDILSGELPLDKLVFPKNLTKDGMAGLQRGLSALMIEGSRFEVEVIEGEIAIKSV
jgi:hypothetical protein